MAEAFVAKVSEMHGAETQETLTESQDPNPNGDDSKVEPSISPKASPKKDDGPQAEAADDKDPQEENEVKQEPQDDEPVFVICHKCDISKDIADCLRKGKKWLCSACNTATAALSRALEGGLRAEGFRSLSAEEQTQFWQQAAGASQKSLVTLYNSKLKAVATQHATQGSKGCYQPLSWYEAQGYDAEAIRLKTPAEDRRTHPILGETFRVSLEYTDDSHTKALSEERMASGSVEHGVAAAASSAPAKPPADKKLTPAQQAKFEAKLEKSNGKLCSAATKVLATLQPCMIQYREIMAEAENKHEAGWNAAKDMWKELNEAHSYANDTIAKYNRNSKQVLLNSIHLDDKSVKVKVKNFQAMVKQMRPNKRKATS